MPNVRRGLRTWGDNKSVRLRGFDYSQHEPYHIIVRTRPDTRPFADRAFAEHSCTTLTTLLVKLDAYLGCFCLMPDHLHLLFSPDRSELTVGSIVGRYKGLTTAASWKHGLSGRLWQTRFYDHIVRMSENVRKVAQYIYENPERRGLPAEYPFRWIDPAL